MKNEHERAKHYESDKDNVEEWGEPTRPTTQRRLASMVSVRLAPDEAEAIRAAAERLDVSVSSFIRSAAVAAARAENRPAPAIADAASIATVTLLGVPPGADPAQVGDTYGVLMATS